MIPFGTTEDLVENAVLGLESDSQNGVFKSIPVFDRFSKKDWEICDDLQSDIGSPIRTKLTVEQMRAMIKLA